VGISYLTDVFVAGQIFILKKNKYVAFLNDVFFIIKKS
jgi:hypothetical protein